MDHMQRQDIALLLKLAIADGPLPQSKNLAQRILSPSPVFLIFCKRPHFLITLAASASTALIASWAESMLPTPAVPKRTAINKYKYFRMRTP